MVKEFHVFTLFIGVLGLVWLQKSQNDTIYENAKSVTELKYHNHGPPQKLPYTMDGELIYTLDGIGGWY